MRKYQKVASLMSNRLPAGVTIEAVFELLLDEHLERNDPARREQRRRARRARVQGKNGDNGNGAGEEAPPTDQTPCETTGSGRSEPAVASEPAVRRIPSAVRDRIHLRDGGRCTFQSPDGERCKETQRLHIDHVIPWALGGTHAPENLRLLCAGHNQLQADRHFGAEHIARRRQE